MTTPKQFNKNKNDYQEFYLIKLFTTIIKDIGLPGFIVAAIAFIIYRWADDSQRKEIIDTYVLFKNQTIYNFPSQFVVLILVLMILIGTYFYNKEIKMLKEEIERLKRLIK